MKKLILLACLALGSLGLSAQVEEKTESFQIKIVKEVDGKSELIEKKFDSKEEMHAWLKANGHDINIEGVEKGWNTEDAKKMKIRRHMGDQKNTDGQKRIEVIINSESEQNFEFDADLSEEELAQLKERHLKHEGANVFIHRNVAEIDELKKMLKEEMMKYESEKFSKEQIQELLKSIEHKLENLHDGTENEMKVIMKRMEAETSGDHDLHSEQILIVKCHFEVAPLDEADKEILSETGIDVFAEELALDNVSVYPNPNQGVFTMGYELASKSKTKLILFDTRGNIVLEKDLGKVVGKGQVEIDLSEMASGIYYVQLGQGNKTATRKIIKQ